MSADWTAADLAGRLARWPAGYCEGWYRGRRYAATLTRSADGRRLKLFAEELGGADRVSCNLYALASGARLKPCEMPAGTVARFILGFQPA